MGKIKVLFIILARKGSKGVSNKNFRKINGKPLFQYILEAALEAKIKINSNFDELKNSNSSFKEEIRN